MDKTTENKAILNLKAQGYSVEVNDPNASTFSRKYKVYKDFLGRKKYAVTDANGNIIALQG